MAAFEPVNSGLGGLDRILDFIRLGDNVVWQVGSLEEYLFFVKPYVKQSIADGRNLIYMHFTGHPMLVEPQDGLKICEFDPKTGFETFTTSVRHQITAEGRDAFYVFDCLSDLQVAWATDLMMGNFFRVTCPYLFELDTVAFFPILRGRHSYDAVARIRDTTQLLMDVYSDKDDIYLNPLKCWNRYSRTMFLPHCYDKNSGEFLPLKGGLEISRFYNLVDEAANLTNDQNLDSWDRFVGWAKLEYQEGRFLDRTRRYFAKNMMTRDKKMLDLVERYYRPKDYFLIQSRMIGSGGIGGKACGMLTARKIVEEELPEVAKKLEPHDSFYVGSDVFYTYIVHNGFWKLRILQKTKEGYFKYAAELKEALGNGVFPENIRAQFRRMLEYYGQRPIIVRSSSLQEDGFGNAFAGKYESVICINTGSMEERLEALERAVRQVYASTMDVSALEYRRQRGLEEKDEQMAILIQRVSGTMYGDFFMPNAAGVGYSYSAYRWEASLDPAAGMLRLVMGLGTRAVDRTEGDYPRIVSLAKPEQSSLVGSRDKHRYSQNMVDVLDYESCDLISKPVSRVVPSMPKWYKNMVLEHDYEAENMYIERGQHKEILFASCQGLTKNKTFVSCMKDILHTLQRVYDYPVDIEFAINGEEEGDFVINLLQCRPLQIGTNQGAVDVPVLEEHQTIFDVCHSSMGGSRRERIDIAVWVDAKGYYKFPYKEKAKVALVVGDINRWFKKNEPDKRLMLFVPGRIGTSSPELGLPVTFADINRFCAICEVSDSSTGYMPELYYGSHMFQDLVETGIFYTAIFETEKTRYFNRDYFMGLPNHFLDICPKFAELADIVHVCDLSGKEITLWSDILNERTLLGSESGKAL